MRFLTRFLSLSSVKRIIWQYCLSMSLTALLYFLVSKLVFAELKLGIEPSPVWPPAGIGLFVLLSQGRQAWLGVTLGILLMGSWLGVGWSLALGSALGGTLEALVGVSLLRRVGFQNDLERLPDVLNLIGLAGLAAPLLNATISTGVGLATGLIDRGQIGQTWWTFWLGDSMGILVFTPLLLVCSKQLRRRQQGQLDQWSEPQLVEKLICFSLLLSVSILVFWLHPSQILVNYPIEYLPFPFVIWAALRFGQTAGILASFMLSIVAITGTVAGCGPFATMTSQMPQQSRQVILLQQAFLAVVTMTTLILATLSSERRRVGELLRQNQASLAKAQQLARLGNWDFDFKQRQWRWSDELYRLLGLAPGMQPDLQHFLQAVHPADRAAVEQAMQLALMQRVPYRMNYRIALPDGRERIIEDQVAIGLTHATGTILDITEYKKTEEKLRINAERNRLLSEMALRIRQSLELDEILDRAVQEVRQFLQADRVLICRFDRMRQGRVIAEAVLPEWTSAISMTSEADVYPEIEALFAAAPICVVNDTAQQERTPFIRQYHDRYQVRAGIGVALLSASEASGSRLFGLMICHQCSRPRQWEPLEIELLEQLGTQVAIAIQQGQLYQQVQDLNESLEQQVVERTAQLEANLAKLGEMNQIQNVFLHAIAHDLRTTVVGTLMVLNHFQQQPGEQVTIPRCKLAKMTQSGDIQLCKLDSLLEVYRNKTEGITLDLQPTPILPIIHKSIAQLQPLFEQNQTQLDLELADLPQISADPDQIERVFKHLLVNAVKHNPPGVRIVIQAAAQPDCLWFAVADSGTGISEAEQMRLFDLRTHEGSQRQLTGIGVGLCLCHQIISAHGGEIAVETAANAGSRFWFTLPMQPLRDSS
jgi:PAS domain S-box-containing protein